MAKIKYNKDSINIFKTDKEKVQNRPTLYVPTTDELGATHIMFEIIDNSIDEVVADKNDTKQASFVKVTYDVKTHTLRVEDDGRGIPLERLEDVCMKLMSSAKHNNTEDTAYTTSGGINGIGLKLAVYLSEYCKVISIVNGKYKSFYFEKGNMVEENKGKSKDRGTTVEFKLSQSFIDIKGVNKDTIITRFEEKAYLNPDINLSLTITKGDKIIYDKSFKNKKVEDKIKEFNPSTPIISIKGKRTISVLDKFDDNKPKKKKVAYNIVFALSENALDKDSNTILAYGNGIKNYMGGSHVIGLKEGLVKFFKEATFQKNNKKSDEQQIMSSDITSGICAFVSVHLLNPEFRGQYKDELSNVEAKIAIRDAIYDHMNSEKSSIINSYKEFILAVANGRMASKKTRKRDINNAFSKDKIDKYRPILKTVKTVDPELLIVEGDSAMGAVLVGADIHNQAIYSIFGRPKNQMDDKLSTVQNTTSAFNDSIAICGLELGKNLDISKSEMKRVLLLADSDVDGKIISASFVGLFAKHCPEMIHAGMIGRIEPPAYSYIENKTRVYALSQKELFKNITKRFTNSNTLYKDNTKFNKKELAQFLDMNLNYEPNITSMATRYSIDPVLLEFIILHYSSTNTVSNWEKIFNKKKEYIDIEISKTKKLITIHGSFEEEMIYIALDDYFHDRAMYIKNMMNRNITINGFKLQNKDNLSLYQVMLAFSEYMPKDVIRYKGLGEFNAKELAELCLDKNKRFVKIFKFDDIEKDMKKIMTILSERQEYRAIRNEIFMNITANDIDIDT